MNAYLKGFNALENDSQRLAWVYALLDALVRAHGHMKVEALREIYGELFAMHMDNARIVVQALQPEMHSHVHEHDVTFVLQTGQTYCKKCECLV